MRLPIPPSRQTMRREDNVITHARSSMVYCLRIMDMFLQIALVLFIATGFSLLMQAIRQPLILGHILTGIVAGPMVLGFLHPEGPFELFAKLGITALLFIVGLSLSPKVVREVGASSVVAGLGQIFFTASVGFLLVLSFGWDPVSAIYIALALTFSSTIIVLKILQDKKDISSLYGRLATGTMLVQDIAATFMLVVMAAIGGGVAGNIGPALLLIVGKGSLLAVGLIFFSRVILPSMTKLFANSQEFLLLFSVAWGVGVAVIFKLMGFSVEVGALVAGVSLATSPYHYEISAKMKILRDFFLVLFFVTLGAGLSFTGISHLIIPAITLSAFVLFGNPIILFVFLRKLGYAAKPSFQTGLTMAQVSEFSLVVILLAQTMGHVGEDAVALVTVCALVTISISAYLMSFDEKIFNFLKPVLDRGTRKSSTQEPKSEEEHHEAILFGCHRLGEDFLPHIVEFDEYLVIDYDPNTIETLQKKGINARYGDAEDNEFIDDLNLQSAKLIVTTLPDVDSSMFLLSKLRKVNQKAIAIVMAHSATEAKLLYGKGASYVILPHFLGGNYASILLDKFGLSQSKFRLEKEKHLRHLEDRLKRSNKVMNNA